MSYAPSGLLSSIATSDGTTLSFTMSGAFLSSASWAGPVSGTLAWTYDDFFRTATRTVGATTVAYTYDADGLPTGTSSPASFVVSHDAGGKNGLMTGATLGSVADAWTYDGFGAPATYSATFKGSKTLYAMSGVTRDGAGRIGDNYFCRSHCSA